MARTPKVPVREARLRAFVASLAIDPVFSVVVDWRPSRIWRSNPQVFDFNGDPCLNVSGCGYCKASAALAAVAAALPDLTPEEASAIGGLAGTGINTVVRALPKVTAARWTVAEERSGGSVNLYRFTRLEPAPFGWIFDPYGRPLRHATAMERNDALLARLGERKEREDRRARYGHVNFSEVHDYEGRIKIDDDRTVYVLPLPVEVAP